MNYEFEREIGFINSQPSLAECLTSFPPVAETFQSSSIKSSALSHSTLIPPPFEQTIPSLNPGSHPRHSRPKHSPNGGSSNGSSPVPAAGSLPPEYPWMKEKKASKKHPLAPAASAPAAAACLSHKGQSSSVGRMLLMFITRFCLLFTNNLQTLRTFSYDLQVYDSL